MFEAPNDRITHKTNAHTVSEVRARVCDEWVRLCRTAVDLTVRRGMVNGTVLDDGLVWFGLVWFTVRTRRFGGQAPGGSIQTFPDPNAAVREVPFPAAGAVRLLHEDELAFARIGDHRSDDNGMVLDPSGVQGLADRLRFLHRSRTERTCPKRAGYFEGSTESPWRSGIAWILECLKVRRSLCRF